MRYENKNTVTSQNSAYFKSRFFKHISVPSCTKSIYILDPINLYFFDTSNINLFILFYPFSPRIHGNSNLEIHGNDNLEIMGIVNRSITFQQL